MTLDGADRAMQMTIVGLMSEALYKGLVCDDAHVQRWAARAHRIAEHASTLYGDAVAFALLDQARADADARTVQYLASSG